MRLALWFTLFATCSTLTACKSGPRVTLCIVDAENSGLVCVDPDENATFHELSCHRPDGTLQVPGLETFNNYVCVSPNDFQALLHACKQGVRL